MLISPPFLPIRTAGQLDNDWLDQAMQGGIPGQGGYPVSYNLGWHGGIHLEAPGTGLDRELVRAIADGEIVYHRKATEKPSPVPEDHPLYYRGAWTSDGCVVIKHETDIGAEANGTATTVVFYSIMMHLHTLRPWVRTGKKIYRKDEIGQAGYIYGEPHKIHFEIVCDNDNLERLIGRRSGELNPANDGRTDAVYGEMYFRLPAGTQIYTEMPKLNVTNPIVAVAHTLAQPLYVGLRYAEGEGADAHRGDLYVSAYREDGEPIGDALHEHEAEYKLYTSATMISKAYRDASAAQVPAASATYELLRFGRIIGPDALNPANTPHWRKIRFDSGEGWVNLNAPGISKFSDADFPQWKGWTLIDDSADLDSRCDSPILKGWLDEDMDGLVDPNEAVSLLGEERVQAKMRRTICKIPTEWEWGTVDARWGWLKKESAENLAPLADEDFLKLRKHIEELAFWEEAGIGIPSNHWHFQPREFIRHFRRCGWLSFSEYKQLIPKHAIRRHSGNYLWEAIQTNLTGTNSIAVRYRISVNKTMRKYGINSPFRQACFFGNAIQETQWLEILSEGSGSSLWYAPWYGRGFLQLTNPENYINYWTYRGRIIPGTLKTALVDAYSNIASLPVAQRSNATLNDNLFPTLTQQMIIWRDEVKGLGNNSAEANYAPADSAGYYWAALKMAKYADITHLLQRVGVTTSQGVKVYYRSPSFWKASSAVNLPGAINNLYSNALNGFEPRCVAYSYALAVLSEISFPDASGVSSLPFLEGYTPRREP